jgi:hypothetical protein
LYRANVINPKLEVIKSELLQRQQHLRVVVIVVIITITCSLLSSSARLLRCSLHFQPLPLLPLYTASTLQLPFVSSPCAPVAPAMTAFTTRNLQRCAHGALVVPKSSPSLLQGTT